MKKIITRNFNKRVLNKLIDEGVHPILARCYASRGIDTMRDLDHHLIHMHPPNTMYGIDKAVKIIADAIKKNSLIMIVADYDCDGATACAVAVRGLRFFGANVDYIVPNRIQDGYGLSPILVERAKEKNAELLITVDNGIASFEGVNSAIKQGMNTIITDHHLPLSSLPPANVIVNPNQQNCSFPSKHLSGVGVIYYVLIALRAFFRKEDSFSKKSEIKLNQLLDLVALGTIADLVPLDKNNRILVANGLKRIRSGKMIVGIEALFKTSNLSYQNATTSDLAYFIGPKINASGRLEDISIGIECLLTDDYCHAMSLANKLQDFNESRRKIEKCMTESALAKLINFSPEDKSTIVCFDNEWHIGVIGILASRLKEKFHKPTFILASDNNNNLLKGSGRSIPGFHLRDQLDALNNVHPNLLISYGGHAMAAGITLSPSKLNLFKKIFEEKAKQHLSNSPLTPMIETDGGLEEKDISVNLVRLIDEQIWGQNFPSPIFSQELKIKKQKIIQFKHLQLKVEINKKLFNGIWFQRNSFVPEKGLFAFRLNCNSFYGKNEIQLIFEGIET